jgi:hypothetical protein
MTLLDSIDFAYKSAGVVALGILIIPKFGEAVISRIFAGSLEKRKQELQIEVERLKAELTQAAESHKVSLQRALVEEQRNYLEENSRKTDKFTNRIEVLNVTLAELKALSKLSLDNPQESYRTTSQFLESAFSHDWTGLELVKIELNSLDDILEAPAGLSDPTYCENIRTSLIKAIHSVEVLLLKLKTQGRV